MAVYLRFALIFVIFAIVACSANEDTSTVNPNWQKIIDGFQGLWSDIKDRIISKYNDVKDFQANTKEDVSQKMNDTYEYLVIVRQHKDELVEQAKNSTVTGFNEATTKLDTWIKEVKDYQDKWATAADNKKDELRDQWNDKMKDDWNGGMNKVISVSQNAKITDKNAGHMTYANFYFIFSVIFFIVYGFLN